MLFAVTMRARIFEYMIEEPRADVRSRLFVYCKIGLSDHVVQNYTFIKRLINSNVILKTDVYDIQL